MFVKLVKIYRRLRKNYTSGGPICELKSVLIVILFAWAVAGTCWAVVKNRELREIAEEQKRMQGTVIRQNEILALNTAVVKALVEVTKKYDMQKSVKDELKLKEIKL